MNKYLSRDVILKVQDYRTDEVEIPEWGGIVLVRELTAAQVQALGFGMATEDGGVDPRRDPVLMTRIAAWGIIDENGKQLFSEDDIEELGQKAYGAIQRIAEAVMRLSDLSPNKGDSEKNE